MSRKKLWKSVLAIVLIAVMMTTNAATALAEIAEPATAVTAEETVIAEEGIVEELAEAGDDEAAEDAAEEFVDDEAAGDAAEELVEEETAGDDAAAEDFEENSVAEPEEESNIGQQLCEATMELEEKNNGYEVTVSAGEGGTVEPSETVSVSQGCCIIVDYSSGSEIDLNGYNYVIPANVIIINEKSYTATANYGYIFVGWLIKGSTLKGSYEVKENTEVAAHFRKLCTVKFTFRGANSAWFYDLNKYRTLTEMVWPEGFGIGIENQYLHVGPAKIESGANDGFDFVCWEGIPEPDEYGSRCIFSDRTITAVFKPQITKQPENKEAISGNTVTFGVEVNNMDELSYQYQWQSSANGKKWTNIKSATKSKYSVAGSNKKNGYQYRCLVSYGKTPTVTDAATAISEAASLTVKEYKTVTFDMQGHGTKVADQSVTEGTAATEPTPAPAATGYTFGGWYTESSCVNKWDFTQVITEDITLYAQWTENAYTITYELNGGTNSSENPSTYTVTTPTITLKDATKTGYTFDGWYSDSEFTTRVTGILQGSIGDKTFYAKWTPIKYTITYVLDGGTNSSENPEFYTVSVLPITLKAPTRKGYTFGGWYSDKALTKKVTEITKGSTGNKTFYAKWTANAYTVVFDGNGATGSMKNQSRYYGDGKELTANTFKRTGYTFAGWNTKADGSGNKIYEDRYKGSLSTKAGATVTLYAQWTANAYTVVFNGNGATGSMKNQSRYYGDGKELTANTFKRTGYTFTGWNTKADGSGNSVKDKTAANLKKTAGTLILYAQWTKTYTITYMLDGGTNSSKNPASYTVTTSTITLAKPTKTGYTFVGWYSDSKLTTKVTEITKGSTGNKKFYAKWKKK